MPNSQPWIDVYINKEFSGIQALLNFAQLERGAYIGLAEAKEKFYFREDKVGANCPGQAVGASRSLDDGSFLISMAHAQVLKLIPRPPPELLDMNWFIALLRIKLPDELLAIEAVIYYPDAKYRSPETMLGTLLASVERVPLIKLPTD